MKQRPSDLPRYLKHVLEPYRIHAGLRSASVWYAEDKIVSDECLSLLASEALKGLRVTHKGTWAVRTEALTDDEVAMTDGLLPLIVLPVFTRKAKADLAARGHMKPNSNALLNWSVHSLPGGVEYWRQVLRVMCAIMPTSETAINVEDMLGLSEYSDGLNRPESKRSKKRRKSGKGAVVKMDESIAAPAAPATAAIVHLIADRDIPHR